MTILDLLDSCDNQFKEKYIKNAFDFIKEEKNKIILKYTYLINKFLELTINGHNCRNIDKNIMDEIQQIKITLDQYNLYYKRNYPNGWSLNKNNIKNIKDLEPELVLSITNIVNKLKELNPSPYDKFDGNYY